MRRVAVDSALPSLLRLMKNVSPISFGWLLTRRACADIRTGGSILLRLMREFHSLQVRHGEDPASGKPQRRKREPHSISCTVVCPSRSFNGSKPGSLRCMDQGARLRGHCSRRRLSPYGEIDTATFDDRHNTHGSLPMVSENNTSRKNMVSNAENQVVRRCTAGNQALRRASRNPSCTTSIFPNSS